MLMEFTGTHRGFRAKRRVGEILEWVDKRWVIIRILNMKLITGKVPVVKGSFIAQQVGNYVDYSNYYEQTTISDRIPLEGGKYWDKNIRQVGEVINLTDEERFKATCDNYRD